MTDDVGSGEGAEEAIEDLEAPAASWGEVAGGRSNCPAPSCALPTSGCSNPTCSATWCKPGTVQGCTQPTCGISVVLVQ